MTLSKGLICNLSNSLPSFENICHQYTFDQNEYLKCIENKKGQFRLDPVSGKSETTRDIEHEEFYELTKWGNHKNTSDLKTIPDKIQIKNGIFLYLLQGIPMFLTPFFLVFVYPKFQYSGNVWGFVFIFGICIIPSLFSFYKAFDKRTKILINKDGIYLHKIGFIHWQRVVITLIKETTDGRGYTNHYIVFGLNGEFTSIEFPLKEITMSVIEFENYIELYKNLYWQKQIKESQTMFNQRSTISNRVGINSPL